MLSLEDSTCFSCFGISFGYSLDEICQGLSNDFFGPAGISLFQSSFFLPLLLKCAWKNRRRSSHPLGLWQEPWLSQSRAAYTVEDLPCGHGIPCPGSFPRPLSHVDLLDSLGIRRPTGLTRQRLWFLWKVLSPGLKPVSVAGSQCLQVGREVSLLRIKPTFWKTLGTVSPSGSAGLGRVPSPKS